MSSYIDILRNSCIMCAGSGEGTERVERMFGASGGQSLVGRVGGFLSE